jgi:glutamate-5-semialdehyde dehydrogenase
MNAPLKALTGSARVGAKGADMDANKGADLDMLMRDIAHDARAAARVLALAPAAQKNRALAAMAKAVRRSRNAILAANAEDQAEAKSGGATPAFLDRLSLDAARVEAMAEGLDVIRKLKDPIGTVMESWRRPNGMRIERVRVPLGVIGVIFESRPNVTADAGALCLKAGNAAILRGGSESFRSCRAIHAALVEGLAEAGLPRAAITLVPTRDRAAVGMMLAGLDGALDVIVPRGGKGLVERVQKEARVPVFAHLEGVCHVYVDGKAKLPMAKKIVLNAKMRRTGVCGAAETLLVDRSGADKLLKPLITMLLDAGCEIRGDAAVLAVDPRVKPASEADWSTEYLDAILTAGVVDGVDDAIAHIERYGSHHTDAIVTEDKKAADKFLREVDSAIVLQNASTQFADGGEFGFGAEIGIATGRMHARGPVGVEQLTSFKYRIRGTGQTRP